MCWDKMAEPPRQDSRTCRPWSALCQVLRSDTKVLIRANVSSWEIGRAEVDQVQCR